RDGGRPEDAPVVVMRLDDGLHRAADADPVASANERLAGAILGEERRVHLCRVVRAVGEDVANFDATLDLEPTTAPRAGIVLANVVDVDALAREVAPRDDVAKVRVLPVGSGDVPARPEPHVHQPPPAPHAHPPAA